MHTYANGFIADNLQFSGWVMLRLSPVDYDWRDWIYKLSLENKDILVKPEFDCHVTLAGNIHRDDLVKYYTNKLMFPLYIGERVIAENCVSYFNNDTSVAKYAIKDSVSYSKLWAYRNQVFSKCRSLENYPNYMPHITVGYLKKGCHFSDNLWKPTPHIFNVESIIFSYKDDNGNTIEW